MNATRIFWATRDRAPHLSLVVIGGLAAAGVLRLVGVPPIDLHGPLHYIGVMDPFCGGTRATYLLSTGDLAGARRYNPIVFVLAAVAAGILLPAAVGMTRERWLDIRLSKRPPGSGERNRAGFGCPGDPPAAARRSSHPAMARPAR